MTRLRDFVVTGRLGEQATDEKVVSAESFEAALAHYAVFEAWDGDIELDMEARCMDTGATVRAVGRVWVEVEVKLPGVGSC